MVRHSSLLLIGAMQKLSTSTRSFTSGMAAGLFCSSPFLLTEPAPWNHLRFAGKRSWLLPTYTGNQLCIVHSDHSLRNTKSFQLNMQLTSRHLNTNVTLTWQLHIFWMKEGATTTSTVPCTNWFTNRLK